MSASEKLKALGAVLYETPPESDTVAMHKLFDLADALPQIVAVIEAAERETGMEDDTEEARMRQVPRLRAALTALEEALS